MFSVLRSFPILDFAFGLVIDFELIFIYHVLNTFFIGKKAALLLPRCTY